jgi:hypothetical protein
MQIKQIAYIPHEQQSITCVTEAVKTDKGMSPIIICPVGYRLDKVEDPYMGGNPTESFKYVGQVPKAYSNGDVLHYNVYIYSVTVDDSNYAFKNVTIKQEGL